MLNARQQRFIDEYLVDLNATAAYQRAGYRPSGHTAESAASRLLSNVEVQSEIKRRQQQRADRIQVTTDEVLTECKHLAFSDIGEIVDFSGQEPKLRPANQIPEHARRAIASIRVKRYTDGRGEDARRVEVTEFKLWNKTAALERLGDHLGIWGKPEGGVLVNVTITTEDVLEAKRRVAECRRAIGAPPLITSDGDGQVQDIPP
jgi:phage terminase small subunit